MFRRILGWDKPPADQPPSIYIDPDEQARVILQDFVNTIVEGFGFWAAMLAVVHKENNEERLTVKAFATRLDSEPMSRFMGRTLLDTGERLSGQKLFNNYVVMNSDTEKINQAVAAIRQDKPYAIVDDLYALFAPRVSRETAGRLQRLANVKKIITVPFRNRSGQLVGNLYAAREVDDMPEEKIKQLQAFSRMATTVMDHLVLRYETAHITGREDVLKDTITQMLSNSLNEQRLLQTIVNSAVHRLGFKASMLSVVRQHEGKRIIPVMAYQFSGNLGALIERGEQLAGRRLKGAWVYVDEETAKVNVGVRAIMEGSPNQKTNKLSELFSPAIPAYLSTILQGMFGIKAMVTVPLRNKNGELRGNLYAATDREEISETEIEDLKTFALAASIAIETAQHVRETQRMGLLASNIGNLIHRLNSVLGGARWDVEQTLTQIEVKPDHAWLAPKLENVYEQIIAATKMIEGLHQHLHQPGQDSDENSLIDVNAVIQTARDTITEIYHYAIPEGIQIKTQYCKDRPFILASTGDSLAEVFRILIKNACEAMGKTGTIDIVTEIRDASGDREREICITMSDNGQGIPTEERTKLFQLNDSSKKGGLGYGLWNAKLTVEWLGGRISCESFTAQEIAADVRLKNKQPGTIFTIYLPVVDVKDVEGKLMVTA